MAMRNSDVTFLRREVVPLLTKAAHLTPEAADVLDRLNERINTVLEPEQATWSINRWFEKHTITGDFSGWHCTLTYDGHEIPYIHGTYYDRGEYEGSVYLTLDNRYGLNTTVDELGDWIMFLANAMAVSAGRTSHGPNSYVRNPHGRSGAGDPPETKGYEEQKVFNIIVNGITHPMALYGGLITYDQIVNLANQPDGATVVYQYAAGNGEGTLTSDRSVYVKDNTIFDCVLTNNA